MSGHKAIHRLIFFPCALLVAFFIASTPVWSEPPGTALTGRPRVVLENHLPPSIARYFREDNADLFVPTVPEGSKAEELNGSAAEPIRVSLTSQGTLSSPLPLLVSAELGAIAKFGYDVELSYGPSLGYWISQTTVDEAFSCLALWFASSVAHTDVAPLLLNSTSVIFAVTVDNERGEALTFYARLDPGKNIGFAYYRTLDVKLRSGVYRVDVDRSDWLSTPGYLLDPLADPTTGAATGTRWVIEFFDSKQGERP